MSLSVEDLPQRTTLSAVANAAGVCTITFRVPGQVAWEVSQITAELPGAPFGAVGELRVNDALVTPFVAPADAMGGDPPLSVYAGDVVTVIWTGATPGAQGKVLILYRTAGYRR